MGIDLREPDGNISARKPAAEAWKASPEPSTVNALRPGAEPFYAGQSTFSLSAAVSNNNEAIMENISPCLGGESPIRFGVLEVCHSCACVVWN